MTRIHKNGAGGLLVIISGPSGVGKGTVIDLLRKRMLAAKFLLSQTTRKKRPDEKDGEDYNFVSEEEFKKGIEEGKYLEWAIVHGKDYYGVLKESVQKYLDERKLVIREVDVQGAESMRKLVPKNQLLTIFIAPESEAILLSRINHRGKLPDEEVARRMESMKKEMAASGKFDYKVINYEGQIERCYMDVEGIISSAAENHGILLGGAGGALV